MRILAIETSCDETAIAIADFRGPKTAPQISVLSHLISSQVRMHQKFGGVVPNLAKREHQKNLVPVLLRALNEVGQFQSKVKSKKSGVKNKKRPQSATHHLHIILEREPDLRKQFEKKVLPLVPPDIDTIAVTAGPGLAPALWVGLNFAKALAYLWSKPLIPVNHMAGHLYSAFLQKSGVSSKFKIQNSKFPILALLVSGGHTELVLSKGHGKFRIIGETLDDAAGEAFDKVARLLGLPYPGGPFISALAEKKPKIRGSKLKVKLPRPMFHSNDYNFSFSGLKTAVLYLLRDLQKKYPLAVLRPLVAREFQDAIVEVLVKKTVRAAKEFQVKTVLLGGGVAANKKLRKNLTEALSREMSNARYLMPNTSLTGDNALMIALAAFMAGKKKALDKVGADANMHLR